MLNIFLEFEDCVWGWWWVLMGDKCKVNGFISTFTLVTPPQLQQKSTIPFM